MYQTLARAGGSCDLLVDGGILAAGLRRDLADLNRQFLDLGLAPEASHDQRFAWTDPVRRTLQRTDEPTRDRMSDCPFALFQVVLPTEPDPSPQVSSRVEDGQVAPGVDGVPAGCLSFLHAALFVAWRLADSAPLAARLAFSIQPAAELWLNELTLSQLTRLATRPGLIRPRWPGHARFWTLLVGAAEGRAGLTLQQAYCVGICLLDADASGDVVGPAPRHRPAR